MVDKLTQPATSDSNDEGGNWLVITVLLLIFILGIIVGYYAFHYKATPNLEDKTDDPQSVFFLKKDHYALLYDSRTKNPIWVKENISKNTMHVVNTNPNLDQFLPNSLSIYQNSEFEVGNLLISLGNETFYLPATSPQVSQFNQGYWKKLDQYVKALPEKYQIPRFVTFTGPLYLPDEMVDGKHYVRYQVLGKDNIAVPTHFFKIIYLPPDIALEPEVYLIPNQSISPDVALETFKVSLEKLEEISGISFHKDSKAYFMRPIFMKPIVGPL